MIESGDYISRKAICLTDFEIAMCNGDYKELCKMILDKIANAPAADVRPAVRGHNTGNARIFERSECGYGFADIYLTNERDYPIVPNYCPNCGAWMEES